MAAILQYIDMKYGPLRARGVNVGRQTNERTNWSEHKIWKWLLGVSLKSIVRHFIGRIFRPMKGYDIIRMWFVEFMHFEACGAFPAHVCRSNRMRCRTTQIECILRCKWSNAKNEHDENRKWRCEFKKKKRRNVVRYNLNTTNNKTETRNEIKRMTAKKKLIFCRFPFLRIYDLILFRIKYEMNFEFAWNKMWGEICVFGTCSARFFDFIQVRLAIDFLILNRAHFHNSLRVQQKRPQITPRFNLVSCITS